jgi:hypothetical protein
MASFDFITNDDFRTSLEADHAELCKCLTAGAWKAVHVLAGSIIEALLLDCLQSSGYSGCSASGLLRMDLGQLITTCRAENILSAKSADLSSVVRTYRNLIHPGRLVRLGEVVNQHGATIAQSLVEIIVEEVAARKKETYGYTAEQIANKIESDLTAVSIISHLLRDAKPQEIERLLVKILPGRLFDLCQDFFDDEEAEWTRRKRSALAECFRAAFGVASDDIKRKATQNFATIVKEEAEPVVLAYETTFFRGSDLAFLCVDDANMIKKHIRGRIETDVEEDLLTAAAGIGRFLTTQDVCTFVDPLVKTLTWAKGDLYWATHRFLIDEYARMQSEVSREALGRLQAWADMYRKNGNERALRAVQNIQETIDPFADLDETDPFTDE